MNGRVAAAAERGQAMAEFAVAVSVLVLLLLAMPVLGRYHELQVATLEGARQLAFQSSWRQAGMTRASTEAIRGELFINTGGADQPEAGTLKAQFAFGTTPGLAGRADRALLAPFAIASRLNSGFDLRDGALYHADLRVAVLQPPGLPEPFAAIPMELSGSYTLLGDAWSSVGPEQVARRSGGLLVTRAAQPLRPLMALGAAILSIVEPAFRQFCPGVVDPERVPADRLGTTANGDSGPVTRWATSC